MTGNLVFALVVLGVLAVVVAGLNRPPRCVGCRRKLDRAERYAGLDRCIGCYLETYR